VGRVEPGDRAVRIEEDRVGFGEGTLGVGFGEDILGVGMLGEEERIAHRAVGGVRSRSGVLLP
jgi:hypothetical protein